MLSLFFGREIDPTGLSYIDEPSRRVGLPTIDVFYF